ncbi:MAG: PAS domain S-box protein [Syntrophaceae bacterium]|nr:PAS domain S-box protein [Syntrophaceae bacterium]
MALLNLLTLQILDALVRIEAWSESAILDNEDSPTITALGLFLVLLFGLLRRCAVRIRGDAEAQRRACRTAREGPCGDRVDPGEYRFDLQGRIVDVPRGAENLLGADRESILGSLFSRFLREKDVPPVIDGFIRVLRGESVDGLRVILRRADGSLVPARMDLHPVVRAGEIDGVRGLLRASPGTASIARRETGRTGLCVYIFRKGEMLYVNPRFAESCGYGRHEISSVDPMQIIHPADRSRVRRSNIGQMKGEPGASCDFRLVTKDGRVRWVRARVRPVTYRGQKALLGNLVVMSAREQTLQGRGDTGGRRSAAARCGCSAPV